MITAVDTGDYGRHNPRMPKLIPVGKNYAIVDDDDYERVKNHLWHIQTRRYAAARLGGKLILMHRYIMGDTKGIAYDHKNGFGLDNRRDNIRIATQAENSRNVNKQRPKGRPDPITSSKYKGVSWRTDRHRWQAYIGTGKDRDSLGCYETEDLAAAAYNKAAIVRYGEFANLNEIE